ncbi:hypothetical protein BDQ17DRAFT_1247997 [Cyathus striatus]|nr:hypothetical protein BDQ17DRAFT_1247997 [Cyathus striatus]
MPEDPQDHPPEVPLLEATSSFEEFCCSIFMSTLIPGPCIGAILACIHLFHILSLLQTLIWNEPREYKHRLNSKFFEGPKVGFNALRER